MMAGSTPDARGRPGPVGPPQLAPAGFVDGGIEPRSAFGIVELADGLGTELVDDLGGRVPQGFLLRRQSDVHHTPPPGDGRERTHSSRSTRRSTFPDGRRGMSSTTTTWRSCL